MEDHSVWMHSALKEALRAFDKGEVPVGAVVVKEGCIIGKGYNLVETLQDPTAHAELIAITAAANTLASWRLQDSTIYTTLEPCPMCVGAILLSRMRAIVYGAQDPRYGACDSVLHLAQNEKLDVRVDVVSGILQSECQGMLKEFFKKIRSQSKR
jgi:tRNA(adenine34) deaminase